MRPSRLAELTNGVHRRHLLSSKKKFERFWVERYFPNLFNTNYEDEMNEEEEEEKESDEE